MTKQRLIVKWSFGLLIILMGIMQMSCVSDPIKGSSQTSQEIKTIIAEFNHYGNARLNLSKEDLIAKGYEVGDVMNVKLSNIADTIEMPYIREYLEAGSFTPCVWSEVENGKEYVLLIVCNSSFYNMSKAEVGDSVCITMGIKSGNKDLCDGLHLDTFIEHDDDITGALTSNFREAKCSGIKPGVLYRSASPLMPHSSTPEVYQYADNLSRKNGINTIIAMADKENDFKSALESGGKYGEYCRELYESTDGERGICFTPIGVDIYTESAKKSLASVLRYMLSHKPPYHVCCAIGRDRTGIFCILMEILSGATYEELEVDYMTSVDNNYGFNKSNPLYERARSIWFDRLLYVIYHRGQVNLADFDKIGKVDVQSFFSSLPDSVEKYLTEDLGLTADELSQLKTIIKK